VSVQEGGLDLKLELVEFVRSEYKRLGRQVAVFTSDPKTKEDIPCVAVNRIYDSEDDQMMDNMGEVISEPDGATEIHYAEFTQSCELRIWTENADLRDQMFVELKRILIRAKKSLGEKGFGKMVVKSGRDENDFRTYSPLMINWGVLQFSALSPLDVAYEKDTTATPIQEVDQSLALDGIVQTEAEVEAEAMGT
jgi:hypothetical protein